MKASTKCYLSLQSMSGFWLKAYIQEIITTCLQNASHWAGLWDTVWTEVDTEGWQVTRQPYHRVVDGRREKGLS